MVLGPDAGFPEFQPLGDWKSDVVMVDARALAPEARAAAGIKLPEEEIAEHEALDRELEEYGALSAPTLGAEALSALRLAGRARLWPIDEQARRALADRGASLWVAGYTRHSETIWAHRVGGSEPFALWVSRYESEFAGGLPANLARDRGRALVSTRWPDRVLRALSGGAVSEPALLFARRQLARWPAELLVEDDLAHAGVEAAARMAAGEDVVDMPLHGPVRRVRLPGFTLHAWEINPLDVRPGARRPRARSRFRRKRSISPRRRAPRSAPDHPPFDYTREMRHGHESRRYEINEA